MNALDIAIIALAASSGFFGISYNSMKIMKPFNAKLLLIPAVFAITAVFFLTLGHFLSAFILNYFVGYESHVVFFILAGIGVKTFIEGTGKKKGQTVYMLNDTKILLSTAILFSLNYIFIGLTLFYYSGSLINLLLFFGVITLSSAITGLMLGRIMKFHITDFFTIVGGILLIAMGTKILMLATGYI